MALLFFFVKSLILANSMLIYDCEQKKTKLKEMRRVGKYMRKKKMSIEEEMEILMGLIDLKVVSRVLRMNEMNEENLHWCEEKMSKVKIIQGGKVLQRDSTPLFFPPH